LKNFSFRHGKEQIVCKVLINNDSDWIHGIISFINLKKNIVEIFLSSENLKEKFNEGSTVTIKFIKDESEYILSGCITRKILSIHKQAIVVKIDEIQKFANNRKHERFHAKFSAVIKTGDGRTIPSVLGDISLGGILLLTNASLGSGENILIEIAVSDKIPVSFKGKVVRKLQNKKLNSYGIQIETIDAVNKSQLNEVIDLLIAKKDHIAHEWKIFNRIKYTVYAVSMAAIFFIIFVILASVGI